MEILKVRDLKTYYFTLEGVIKAVDCVSFELEKGKTLGLVGESGCGKTTVGMSLNRLVPSPGRIIDGSILLNDEELLKKTESEMAKIRWKEISIVFQGAMNALNPLMKVEDQISEAITLHEDLDKDEIIERVEKLFELVDINPERGKDYPYEFSGGMKQRVLIAMALACNPSVLIADEPTTALDVMVSTKILELMQKLQQEIKMSMLMITHDLSAIAAVSDRIACMYAGKFVEYAQAKRFYTSPLHPYSQALLKAFPSVVGHKIRLLPIPGVPCDLLNPPSGCRFHTRCPYAKYVCKKEVPEMKELEGGHYVACHQIN